MVEMPKSGIMTENLQESYKEETMDNQEIHTQEKGLSYVNK